MNKTLLIVVFLVLFAIGGFAMTTRKKTTDEEKADTVSGVETVPPIVPQTLTGGSQSSQLFQTDEGAGLQAINEQMKRIVKNSGAMQDIRAKEKIGTNLFAGMETKPAFVLKKMIAISFSIVLVKVLIL